VRTSLHAAISTPISCATTLPLESLLRPPPSRPSRKSSNEAPWQRCFRKPSPTTTPSWPRSPSTRPCLRGQLLFSAAREHTRAPSHAHSAKLHTTFPGLEAMTRLRPLRGPETEASASDHGLQCDCNALTPARTERLWGRGPHIHTEALPLRLPGAASRCIGQTRWRDSSIALFAELGPLESKRLKEPLPARNLCACSPAAGLHNEAFEVATKPSRKFPLPHAPWGLTVIA
jgi:hypothetical protein